MRLYALLCFLIYSAVLSAADKAKTKPLSPAEAIKQINKRVVVEMEVKASKNRLENRGEIYLDSEENFRDDNNLGVVINKTGAVKFKEAGIDEPAGHFLGKSIRVTGTVILGDDKRPRIEVDDPKQITVIKK